MAPVVVTICFRELVRDVCQQYSLPTPMYGIPVEDEDGMITVYSEVELVRDDGGRETVRSWSKPCCDIDQAEEDAVRRSVQKLRDELFFEVSDFNFQDKKFFESLYERASADRGVAVKKYKRLKNDYNLIRRYYNDLLAEKEQYVSERGRFKELVAEFHSLLDRTHTVVAAANSSATNSAAEPAAPPGYEAS